VAEGEEVEHFLMNLHQDKEFFAELTEITGNALSIPMVYVEKDYWMTMALKFLSQSPYVEDVVFKGGTSLSKAYRLIHRFSEDIDLAVNAVHKNDRERKKLLKNVEDVVAQGLNY
jgi:predicted nucleotidyltransferase component of viral defense system